MKKRFLGNVYKSQSNNIRFESFFALTCRVFLHLGSVTHECARPHLSVVKPDISTP
jgi:hypothetical protein